MSSELEAAGLAAIGETSSHQNADLTGQACRNCAEPVTKRYCTRCGQLASSFHRPVWALIGESITDTFALDGRLARTLPLLLLRPGRLTKAYTSGQRARFVPPFRLFLLASLIFYFLLFAFIGNAGWLNDLTIGDHRGVISVQSEDGSAQDVRLLDEAGRVDREAARKLLEDADGADVSTAMIDRVSNAYENPQIVLAGVEKWAPRLSFLLVPFTILLLALLHFWRKSIYVYDHTIHALHLHTWIYLMGSVYLVSAPYLSGLGDWLFGFGLLAYVTRSLVVVGDTNAILAVIRSLILILVWIVLMALLVVFSLLIGVLGA